MDLIVGRRVWLWDPRTSEPGRFAVQVGVRRPSPSGFSPRAGMNTCVSHPPFAGLSARTMTGIGYEFLAPRTAKREQEFGQGRMNKCIPLLWNWSEQAVLVEPVRLVVSEFARLFSVGRNGRLNIRGDAKKDPYAR